jgi:hypothetical protein
MRSLERYLIAGTLRLATNADRERCHKTAKIIRPRRTGAFWTPHLKAVLYQNL